MPERIAYAKVAPEVVQAMRGLEEQIRRSSLERPLLELVRMRASQINGCAYCIDMHSKDARARAWPTATCQTTSTSLPASISPRSSSSSSRWSSWPSTVGIGSPSRFARCRVRTPSLRDDREDPRVA